MLSVFITPCTKPTRIQCAIISAGAFAYLREPLGAQRFVERAGSGAGNSGKSRRIVKSTSCASNATSPRDAGSSKLPKRMNDGATRHTIAPGSARGCPS